MADRDDLKRWFEQRVQAIHAKVTVYDILRRNGVQLRHTTDRLEQIPCPFHGKDEHPSARIYPGDASKPAHIWCFVCREHWDAISLWKKYGGDETKKFHRVLSELEKTFGITPPEISAEAFRSDTLPETSSKEAFQKLYQACENRLISVREDYQAFDDMVGYLTAGSVLDKVLYQVTAGKVPFDTGCLILNQLRLRIIARIQRGYEPPSSPTHPRNGGPSGIFDSDSE